MLILRSGPRGNKRAVQGYAYVDSHVAMLPRMYERWLKGYAAIGYTIAHSAAELPSLMAEMTP